MTKSFILFTLLITLSFNLSAQKVLVDKTVAGQRTVACSLEKASNFKDSNAISFGLSSTQELDNTNYYLNLKITSASPLSISNNSKLLLKCNDGSTIELSAIDNAICSSRNTNVIGKGMKKQHTILATYKISQQQVAEISNGVAKVRIETKDSTIDKSFKKDKIGNIVSSEFALINNALSAQRLFTEGF